MNPLSAWTYYRRHVRHTVTLLSLSIVVTLGIASMVALMWGVFVEPGRLAYKSYSEFSLVTPHLTENGPDPAVLARLESNPDIASTIPAAFIRITLPGMIPEHGFQFELLGLMEPDVAYFLGRFDATVKDGRLPRSGAAELVLTEDVARILDVQVGESYVVTSAEYYAGMDVIPDPVSFVVVGILESDTELGILSLEFLSHHGQYRQLPARLLVVAEEGREAAVEGFLRNEILCLETGVMTRQILNERILSEALPGVAMLLPVVLIVAGALSVVIVVVNELANARRLPEFGVLHATGYGRGWLARRLTMETATLALVGWAIGLGLAYLGLHLLKVTVFASQGHDLNYVVWLPALFSVPIPGTVAAFTFLAARRTLTGLDPVSIVERRESGSEAPSRANQRRLGPVLSSSIRPLAASTYLRRHPRRAILLIGGMALMNLAVVLFISALAVDADAQEPFWGYLNQASMIRPAVGGQSLDTGTVHRVEAHPAVERVIRVAPRYHILSATIPPFASAEASPFGVSGEDMTYLVDLYELELKDGRLPRSGTNEMVVPEALARNRDLEVGDVIGDPEQPAYPGAPALDTEFVISGIFARPEDPELGAGLGFISLEFLDHHEAYDIPECPWLLVVPRAGQKEALDGWLENELDGVDTSVVTYRQRLSRIQSKAWQDMLSIALLQGLIALVAAGGLAVLNYIFTAQRHAEFGVLHALGYSRQQLVGRVLGETAVSAGIAWLFSAIAVLAGMILLRFALFAPLGLTFDLLIFTPWMYTLPLPLAVLFASGGTVAHTLSRLDPMAIIERR